MGASGAGKTTLLDVLAMRKTIGVVTGDVLIGGQPLGIEFQRGTAYCEQLDGEFSKHFHTPDLLTLKHFSLHSSRNDGYCP